MSDHDENAADVLHKLVIQQIIPTSGSWLSIFDDGSVRPIACWALIACETHGDSYIAPMVPKGDGDITDASQLEGYRDSLPEMGEEELDDYLSGPPGDEDDEGEEELSH